MAYDRYPPTQIYTYFSSAQSNGWKTIYTIPVSKKFLLMGAWSNKWSGDWEIERITIEDTTSHEHHIFMADSGPGRTIAKMGMPIVLLAGWIVKFYKAGASTGTGSSGCYGYLADV